MNKLIHFILISFICLSWAIPSDINLEKNQSSFESVKGEIDKQISKHLAPSGVLGLSFKDLKSGETYNINGTMSFNPASVIKIPVMIEAFHQIQQNRISMGTRITLKSHNKIPGAGSLHYFKDGSVFTVRKLIEVMIIDSDNTATNMLIEKLGMNSINRYMLRIGLRQTVIKDATMLCKKPGKFNLSSPEDMLIVMDKLYEGKIVSPEASAEMISIMKRQQHKWGIPRFLPRNILLANKTGSLDYVRNDVGIVYCDRPYIVSIFSKNLPTNQGASALVGMISKIIYDKHLEYDKQMQVAGNNPG